MHEAAGVNYYQLLIKNGKMIYATKLVASGNTVGVRSFIICSAFS
jgi:hypothetical protein